MPKRTPRTPRKRQGRWGRLRGDTLPLEERPPPITGEVFRAWRQAMGWSQAETARRIGVSQKSIWNWEKGDYPPPRWTGWLMYDWGSAAGLDPETWAPQLETEEPAPEYGGEPQVDYLGEE